MLQGAGLLSQQNTDAVNRELDAGIDAGNLRSNALQLCFRLRDVAFGGQAGLRALPGEIERVLGGRDIFVRDFEAQLRSAQIRVVASDIAQQCDQDVAAVLLGRGEIGARGFDAAADSSEQIDLPREAKLSAEIVRFVGELPG